MEEVSEVWGLRGVGRVTLLSQPFGAWSALMCPRAAKAKLNAVRNM